MEMETSEIRESVETAWTSLLGLDILEFLALQPSCPDTQAH